MKRSVMTAEMSAYVMSLNRHRKVMRRHLTVLFHLSMLVPRVVQMIVLSICHRTESISVWSFQAFVLGRFQTLVFSVFLKLGSLRLGRDLGTKFKALVIASFACLITTLNQQ